MDKTVYKNENERKAQEKRWDFYQKSRLKRYYGQLSFDWTFNNFLSRALFNKDFDKIEYIIEKLH